MEILEVVFFFQLQMRKLLLVNVQNESRKGLQSIFTFERITCKLAKGRVMRVQL